MMTAYRIFLRFMGLFCLILGHRWITLLAQLRNDEGRVIKSRSVELCLRCAVCQCCGERNVAGIELLARIKQEQEES